MNTGSMERALTPKFTLRKTYPWTAASALVAVGALALFSAHTLEKLSTNGEVAIDLQAFRKLGAVTVALDRTDEKRLILEESKLLARATFAAAEKRPSAHTEFRKIRVRVVSPLLNIVENSRKEPLNGPVLGAVPVVLSDADAGEIASLERARDPGDENVALAQVYRSLRTQFIAAAESPFEEEYGAESVAIARATEALEFEELPEFAAADFVLPENPLGDSSSRVAHAEIETAPTESEVIETSASSRAQSSLLAPDGFPLTADSAVLEPAVKSEKALEADQAHSQTPIAQAIVSPGLDLIPEEPVNTQPTVETAALNTHLEDGKQATGPPLATENTAAALIPPTPEKSAPALDSIPEVSAKADTQPNPEDIHDYSNDVASVYEQPTDSAEYSGEDAKEQDRVVTQASSARPSDLGNGVHRDARGVTIVWNEKPAAQNTVYVGVPGSRPPPSVTSLADAAADIKKSLDKFSFNLPPEPSPGAKNPANAFASTTPEPSVDTKKCETARIGVEAFNPSAEKETLAICRREFSMEGLSTGSQARWWEAYENEAEHWPTLSYLKPGEATSTNRVPLLSTASIRILAALSKSNTHTGTGILFGEVEAGLEIQLLGRSDAPIYLDPGMKVRDASAEATGKRQYIFLNVQPGQPLLVVKDQERKLSAALPVLVKSGMATHLKVDAPREVDLEVRVYDASSAKESRLANLTLEIIGQSAKMGITDRQGYLKLSKLAVFGDFPIYIDVLKNEKSYKNRFRVRPSSIARGSLALFFFDEKRVAGWLSQLAGGLSPYSGLIAGVVPPSILSKKPGETRHLKIGVFEKRNSLVPERYILDGKDRLLSEAVLRADALRYIGVQIPEGPTIPTIVDEQGRVRWSEVVYAQPGVINVVNPEL